MHRVDSPGSINGAFSDGNPATGQDATQLTAAWFNDLQENICTLVEFAGLALEKGNADQVRDAIVAMIAEVVGSGSGEVPTTRQINTTGLLSGGGPLAADLNLAVARASAAQILAGALDNSAITPAGLKAAFAGTSGASGYMPLPGGKLLQWLPATAIGNGTINVTLPTTFQTRCMWAGWSGVRYWDYDPQGNDPGVYAWGTSSISIFNGHGGPISGLVLAFGE